MTCKVKYCWYTTSACYVETRYARLRAQARSIPPSLTPRHQLTPDLCTLVTCPAALYLLTMPRKPSDILDTSGKIRAVFEEISERSDSESVEIESSCDTDSLAANQGNAGYTTYKLR